jgi:serine/threonine protein kinase
VREIHNSLIGIASELRNIKDLGPDDLSPVEGLVKSIVDLGSPEPTESLGALKVFKIPDGNLEQKNKALARLQQEVKALMELQHPAVLRLLHAPHMSAEEHFIVTEYHPKGTLDKHLLTFKGRPLEALIAFRSLVEGVVAIHSKDAIHRDIKTQNIFIATDGHLVLGDFGIVFFRDQAGTRYTETFGERVGSHYWMAPWAYEPIQLALEKVSQALDIYPLAKVLWSLVAGRDGFPYWEYDADDNNLEKLFPEDPIMPLVNELLAKCVVRHEKDCRSGPPLTDIREPKKNPEGEGLDIDDAQIEEPKDGAFKKAPQKQ